jgi:hypothetical protein
MDKDTDRLGNRQRQGHGHGTRIWTWDRKMYADIDPVNILVVWRSIFNCYFKCRMLTFL